MRIIILGAGQVGVTLAANLCEEHEVTLVDVESDRMHGLETRLDIRTLQGSGAYPHVLEEAGCNDADMLIAVTSSDECNIVACQIAYCLFSVPVKIARIRCRELEDYPELFQPGSLNIDLVINPAELVTQRIKKLIDNPGAMSVLDFAEGRVNIASFYATPPNIMIGKKLSDLRRELGELQVEFLAIGRNANLIPPLADTFIEPHDEIIFSCRQTHLKSICQHCLNSPDRYRRIIIAGGGNIGVGLAKALEERYQVKVIDRNPENGIKAFEELSKTVIIKGDVSDTELLTSENIDDTDLYCAVTNDDDANIMSSILAKRLGAKNTMALVNRQHYAHLMIERSPDINIGISPQRITSGVILKYLRKGDMVNVWPLPRYNAEAIEIIAHGSKKNSRLINVSVKRLGLPKSCVVAAVMRGDDTYFPEYNEVTIQEGDHVIIFVSDRTKVDQIEKLFQVEPTFL